MGSGPLGFRARGSERAFRQRVHFDQLVEHVAGLLSAPAFLASFDAFGDGGAHLVSADETAPSQPFGDVDGIDQRDVTVGPPGLESVDDGGGREAWLGLGRTLEAEGREFGVAAGVAYNPAGCLGLKDITVAGKQRLQIFPT